jgi:hypothetical protein
MQFPFSFLRKRFQCTTAVKQCILSFIAALLLPTSSAFADSAKLTFNGHSYQRFDTAMNWTAAKALCESKGAHLATITSQAENDFVVANFVSTSIPLVLLGASDTSREGTWQWVTGESWAYTNWYPGEPNNGGGLVVNENYLAFHLQNGVSKWNDIQGTSNPALCEWESATTIRYNAATDFSPTANPSGAWSYGYKLNSTASFQLFDTAKTNLQPGTGFQTWNKPTIGAVVPYVIRNPTNAAVKYASFTLDAGALGFHPGLNGEQAVVRWTAPSSGTYQIEAAFRGLDSTSTVVGILKNGTSIFNGVVNAFGPGPTYSMELSLGINDTLDFVVDPNGSYLYDSTGLAVTITGGSSTIPTTGALSFEWHYPVVGTLGTGAGREANPAQITVGSGVELTGFFANPVFDVDVSPSGVRLFNFRSYTGYPNAAQASAASFNGFVLRVPRGNPLRFSSAIVGPGNTLAGLTQSRVGIAGDQLTVDMAGLSYNPATVVEVSFATTGAASIPTVAIPATSFLRGQSVALSTASAWGADTLLNAPPYASVANSAEWDITIPTTGRYELFAEYAALTSRPVVISFNGTVAFASALTATTGGWLPANRQNLSQGFVQLTAGKYTMRVASSSVFPHIRGFTLVGVDPQVNLPTIESVSPTTVILGVPTVFQIKGKNLQDGLGFTVADCEYSNFELESTTSTEKYFRCTPFGDAGTKNGIVKTAPGGTSLHSFSVNAISKVLPAVYVRSNQTKYKSGDAMHIGLSAYAEGSPDPYDLYLAFDTPSGVFYRTESGFSLTREPAIRGISFNIIDWIDLISFNVDPTFPIGNYAVEVTLVDSSTGQVIGESSVDFYVQSDISSSRAVNALRSEVGSNAANLIRHSRATTENTSCVLGGMIVRSGGGVQVISDATKRSLRVLQMAETFEPTGALASAYRGVKGGYNLLSKGEGLCNKMKEGTDVLNEITDVLSESGEYDPYYSEGKKTDLFAINLLMKVYTSVVDVGSAGALTPVAKEVAKSVKSGVQSALNLFDLNAEYQQAVDSSGAESAVLISGLRLNLHQRYKSWGNYLFKPQPAKFQVIWKPIFHYITPAGYTPKVTPLSEITRKRVAYGTDDIVWDMVDPLTTQLPPLRNDVKAGLYLVTSTRMNPDGTVATNANGGELEVYRDTVHVGFRSDVYHIYIRR